MNIAEQVLQLKTDFDEVYYAGYSAGQSAGGDTDAAYQQGVTDGKQAEYDAFWDAMQDNGSRTNYENAFGGKGWTDATFRPKYPMQPVNGSQMFRATDIQDLVDCLEKAGVSLDFSKASSLQYTFYYTDLKRIGTVDCSSAIYTNGLFANSPYLATIEEVKFSDKTGISADMFGSLGNLVTVTFNGVVSKSVNFNWSPLSVASMKSIISCLANLTGTAGEGVYSIKFNDACWEALEADSTAPDGGTWKDYVTFTLGWVT